MMLFLENIRLAFSSLKANKMRSLLTMLGIIIGISSVIAIVTVGNSLASSLSDSMTSIGANNITVYLTLKEEKDETTEEGYIFKSTNNAGVGSKVMDEELLTDEMIREFKAAYPDEVYAISANQTVVSSGTSTVGKNSAAVNVIGISAGYFVEKNIKTSAGRIFNADEMIEGKMLALVSEKYANKLYDSPEDVIGETLVVDGEGKDYTFTVVGVYKTDGSAGSLTALMGMGNQATDVYIPLKAAQSITHTETYASFSVVINSGVDVNKFVDEAKSFFSAYYRNNRTIMVDAYSLASLADEMNSLMNKLTMGISIIAGIALLVGGIGVMNIMLVSITERTREIGTRKALGAPNSSIRTQFIVEAVVICLIGGLIGVLGGIGLGALIVKIMKGVATPSVSSIIGSLLFSMGIGVFFGYYPANKAAKMDPIEALRYE